MVLGVIFILIGVVVGPLVSAPADRVNHNPLNGIPTPILVAVMVAVGLVIFTQGFGTYLKKRKR